jgi:SNF2 family DNA or RNA helicase
MFLSGDSYGKLTLINNIWMLEGKPATIDLFKKIFTNWVHIHPTNHKTYLQGYIHSEVSYNEIKLFNPGIKHSPAICKDLVWFMQRYPLVMSTEDKKALDDTVAEMGAKQRKIELIFNESFSGPRLNLAIPLRKYQEQAVSFFLETNRLLLADDVGLGKTATSIGPMALPEYRPALVIAQPHLLIQWELEIKRFLPNLKTHIIKGTKPYDLPDVDVIITSYTRLAGWKDVLGGFARYVVFDEIQELRHNTSQKYAAAFKITEKATKKLGLSATPLFNYGVEIFNVMNIIHPGCLGELKEFQDAWCEPYDKRVVMDPARLGVYLRQSHMMLRRTREDVRKELPPINRIVHVLEHDAAEAARVEKTAIQLAIDMMTANKEDKGEAALKLDGFLRQATGLMKAKSVAAWVRVLLEAGEKVLLLGWHREVYDIWLKELSQYDPVMFTGSETAAQKNQSKEAFVEGKSPLMIMSLRSGAGLNDLQRVCSHIVFGELDWSPAIHYQAEGRLNRDELIGSVTSAYLILNTGSDPTMMEVLAIKKGQMDGVINGDTGYEEPQISNADRIMKMAQDLINKSKNSHKPNVHKEDSNIITLFPQP